MVTMLICVLEGYPARFGIDSKPGISAARKRKLWGSGW